MNLDNLLSDSVLNKEQTRRPSRLLGSLDLNSIVRMGLNEHPYGMSPKTAEAMMNTTISANYYGDFHSRPLKEELASFYDLEVENIEVGAGSSSLIPLMGTTFLNEGDEVLMCPTFAAFLDMAGIRGAKPVIVPLKDDMTYDLDGLLKAITDRTKMIVVCNPNNPTGTYKGQKELEQFIAKVPNNIVTLVDEAYLEFATAKDCKSMYPLIKEMPKKPLVVLKTFSKFYGMAGIRVGYALANKELIKAMGKCPRSTISRPGQMGAIQALKDQVYYEIAKGKIVAGVDFLEAELKKLKCTVYHTQTNFIMFNPHVDCGALQREILDRGILISTPMLCRVSVGTMSENIMFIEKMKEALIVLRNH